MSPKKTTQELFIPTKEKARRRRTRYIIFIALLSCVALGGVIYGLFYSPLVRVNEIVVTGNRVADDGEVRALAIKRLDARGRIARFFGSKNMLYWMGVGMIKDAGIPAADSIVVSTHIANHQVSLDIKERVFKGVWCADTCVGFDREGIAFFWAPDVYGTLLLKITNQNADTLVLGNPVLGDPMALQTIFQVLETMQQNGIVIDSVTIKDSTLREWEVKNVQGTLFKFSLDFAPEALDNIFKNLIGKTNLNSLNYVDFRVKNRVYYK